jgi:hypothetical protein
MNTNEASISGRSGTGSQYFYLIFPRYAAIADFLGLRSAPGLQIPGPLYVCYPSSSPVAPLALRSAPAPVMEEVYSILSTPFSLRLSSWDKMWQPIHSRRTFCFSLPQDADQEAVVSDLFAGLKRTVDELPWLAGSVAQLSTQEEGAPPWHWTIAPKGDCRMIVKDLSDTIDYATLRENHFAQKLLDTDTLCPLPQVLHITDEVVPVCRIQANFVRGGLLLVVLIPHVAADGQAITEIIERFARHVRDASLGERSPVGTREEHMDRRALVFGQGDGVIERHPAWTAYPGGAGMSAPLLAVVSCQTFRISTADLAVLKNDALMGATALANAPHPDGQALWLSSHDAVSALFFTRVAQARRRAGIVPADEPMCLVVVVDCRARLGLPASYHGNAMYHIEMVLPPLSWTGRTRWARSQAPCARASQV